MRTQLSPHPDSSRCWSRATVQESAIVGRKLHADQQPLAAQFEDRRRMRVRDLAELRAQVRRDRARMRKVRSGRRSCRTRHSRPPSPAGCRRRSTVRGRGHTRRRLRVARQAPTGKPPPSALASAMMSGAARRTTGARTAARCGPCPTVPRRKSAIRHASGSAAAVVADRRPAAPAPRPRPAPARRSPRRSSVPRPLHRHDQQDRDPGTDRTVEVRHRASAPAFTRTQIPVAAAFFPATILLARLWRETGVAGPPLRSAFRRPARSANCRGR